MPLPLPLDPDFRKACVRFWLEDIDERLNMGLKEDAEHSWREANAIYLSLPPGCGDLDLEGLIYQQRVKLDKLTYS